MNPAERLYSLLVRLYPPEHRREYEVLMLQQARDLGREAGQHGRWQVFRLCLRLLKDGLSNAAIEQMEAIMMVKSGIQPAPWWSVLLAVIPGGLMILSRIGSTPLDLPLMVLGYLYLGLLLIGLPVIWWRRKLVPAWGLLPVGLIAWWLVYLAGTLLTSANALLGIWMGLLQALLALVLFALLLRGRRLPALFWLVAGIILVFNLLMAVPYSRELYGGGQLLRGILTYFAGAWIGPLEGLMLVGIGLLAVRQHGELALLVVAGGYAYMLMDSDYLFASADRTWSGLLLYFIGLILIYMVVMPGAALRARTSRGRALAVFLPVALFHAARIIVPSLVLEGTTGFPRGEIVLSANVLLSLLLGWTLYHPGGGEKPTVSEPAEVAPQV